MAVTGMGASGRLIFGRSHGPDETVWDDLDAQIDPALLQRKGRLLLLAAPDTPRAALSALYQGYYASPSYDVLPSLGAALAACLTGCAGFAQQVSLAGVASGLDVFLVGTRDAAAWMLHRGETRGVLGAGPAEARAIPLGEGVAPDGQSWALSGTHQRLMIGDTLLLSTARVAELRSTEAVGGALKVRRAPRDLAQAASKLGGRERQPALVIQAGGFSSVPAFGGPAKPEPAATAVPTRSRSRGERSPIWSALLVAALAVTLVFVARPPSIPRAEIQEWIELLLTPRPTALAQEEEEMGSPTAQGPLVRPTPPLSIQDATRVAAAATKRVASPAPTPSPRPRRSTSTATPKIFNPPRLLSPAEGESVSKTYVTLEWEWDGELGDDEYFDVRLWQLGTPQRGIAWTKQPRYVERSGQTGWHTWTVAVIRGREGVVLQEYVAAPEVDFRWVVKGGSRPQLSPAPPTRVSPPQPPTRTSP